VSFEEKSTWIYAVTALLAGAVYTVIVGGQVATTPVAEIEYVWPMVAVIVGSVVLSVVGVIAISIAAPREADKRDERDHLVNRRGDQAGFQVLGILALVPLVLAFIEAEHFWIANSLFAAFVLTAVISSAVKIAAYRRGF
jgi:hypothetical protein